MSRSLALPWWLRLWRRLCGLFRRRWRPKPIPRPFAKPEPALADVVAARVRPPPPRIGQRQVPVKEEDIKRLGRKVAVEIARSANEQRIQRWLVKLRDGELYYRAPGPGNQLIKTSGRAVVLPDGTLRLLPPDPRPTKRERAKVRRRLKREESRK